MLLELMKVGVIIHNTDTLKRYISSEAADELLKMNVDLAAQYGADPEVLIDPTIDEEIEMIKKTGTDMAVPGFGTSPYKYNKAGIRTFDSMRFMLHHQRIGFECPIELAGMLNETFKKPQRRRPLLDMLEYDQYRTMLIPHWVKLADMFFMIREGAVGDKMHDIVSP
jgi:hypothetical protein